jgi:hypothetical protein
MKHSRAYSRRKKDFSANALSLETPPPALPTRQLANSPVPIHRVCCDGWESTNLKEQNHAVSDLVRQLANSPTPAQRRLTRCIYPIPSACFHLHFIFSAVADNYLPSAHNHSMNKAQRRVQFLITDH